MNRSSFNREKRSFRWMGRSFRWDKRSFRQTTRPQTDRTTIFRQEQAAARRSGPFTQRKKCTSDAEAGSFAGEEALNEAEEAGLPPGNVALPAEGTG
jgi:hypothetical protein